MIIERRFKRLFINPEGVTFFREIFQDLLNISPGYSLPFLWNTFILLYQLLNRFISRPNNLQIIFPLNKRYYF